MQQSRSKITNNFSKYLKKLNQDMISTTVKLQDTIEDKAKAKLINKQHVINLKSFLSLLFPEPLSPFLMLFHELVRLLY